MTSHHHNHHLSISSLLASPSPASPTIQHIEDALPSPSYPLTRFAPPAFPLSATTMSSSPAIHIEYVDLHNVFLPSPSDYDQYTRGRPRYRQPRSPDFQVPDTNQYQEYSEDDDDDYDADCASEYSYTSSPSDDGQEHVSELPPVSPGAAPFEFARQHHVRSLMAALHTSLADKLARQLAKQQARQSAARDDAQQRAASASTSSTTFTTTNTTANANKGKSLRIQKQKPSAIFVAKANNDSTRGIASPGCLAPPPRTYTQSARRALRSPTSPPSFASASGSSTSTATPTYIDRSVPRSPVVLDYDTAEDTDSDVEPLCMMGGGWGGLVVEGQRERQREQEDDSEMDGVVFDLQSPRTLVGSEGGMEEEEERGRGLTKW